MRNQKYLSIEIEGVDYSEYLTFPYTIQKTAKDQLNTAILTMNGMPQREPFKPFSRVLLGADKYSWVIANDSVKAVYGRGIWDHEITLVDATKMTERILMEAKSFTQPIQRDALSNPSPALYVEYKPNTIVPASSGLVPNDTFITPISVDELDFDLPSVVSLFGDNGPGSDSSQTNVRIYYDKSAMVTNNSKGAYTAIASTVLKDKNTSGTISINRNRSGIYTIEYHTIYVWNSTDGSATYEEYERYIPIAAVDDNTAGRYISLHDVFLQTLSIAEPLLDGDSPRYSPLFEEMQGEQFLTTRAPEFHFPNGRSLYENLREIGRVIHGIPRVVGYNKIVFKKLGSNQVADTRRLDEFANGSSFNVEDYASTIEANFANLINAEQEGVGSVVVPYDGGYQTLRAIDGEFRITDTTGVIKLPFGAAKCISIKVKENGSSTALDITKYLFEKEEYDSLSGFSGVYPYSKTHAIFYTKGSNVIDGLWFRAAEADSATGEVLKKYALFNILNAVSGTIKAWDIQKLAFQVTYIPIISGRARQEKVDFDSSDRSVMAYNQTASELSAKAFGENLRGQIAMFSTPSASKTYLAKDLEDVPEAGLLLDDKYYITQITTRVFPDFCICELGLTENYNEISSYTELKTGIRQYEIPAGKDRYTLLEDFCYIGKAGIGDSNDTYCQITMMKETMNSFGTDIVADDITSAFITTRDRDKKTIAENIVLPVYSTALGTSVYFGFSFADNYSAGESAVELNYADYKGTQYVPYGDYFARATYLNFELCTTFNRGQNDFHKNADNLPNGRLLKPTDSYVRTPKELVWYKDAADSGNVAYQMHFVTNDGWIITSELASMMKYVQAGGYNYSNRVIAYFYDSKINKITGEPREGKKIVKACEIVIYNGDFDFCNIEIVDPPKDGSYESIVLKRAERPCIIGKNTNHLETNKIYFTFRRRRDNQ